VVAWRSRSRESCSLATRTACLIGNGLSIAYNDALSIPHLSEQLEQEFGESHELLGKIAEKLRGSAPTGFESLLGPFSSAAEAVHSLPELEGLLGFDNAAAEAFSTTADCLTQIYRLGVGSALQMISVLARGRGGDVHYDVIERLCRALWDLGPRRDLMVATLNYDGLLHSGLIEADTDEWLQRRGELADLADGRVNHEHELVPGTRLVGWPLRVFDDMPPDRCALVQLHGSLGWLREPGARTEVWRFELESLREIDYWNRWRSGEIQWEPAVLLTDQKAPMVGHRPYSLAYETFTRRLADADRWLIAGYGFGDEPVNRAFREAHRLRSGARPPAKLLVIGLGPEESLRQRVVDELHVEPAHVSSEGLPAAIDGEAWRAWGS
jgi:hypothetical protein